MQRLKGHWKRVPDRLRRSITLLVGGVIIIIAGLVGWLPGPGGMVVFLLGIAVLATEFTWAERLRDYVLRLMSRAAVFAKRRPRLAGIILLGGITLGGLTSFFLYRYVL